MQGRVMGLLAVDGQQRRELQRDREIACPDLDLLLDAHTMGRLLRAFMMFKNDWTSRELALSQSNKRTLLIIHSVECEAPSMAV